MMGLQTEHHYLKGHLFKQGVIVANRHFKWPLMIFVTVRQALAVLRFGHLRHHFLQPGNFADSSLSNRVLNALAKGCTGDWI
jgi:hypothetical protein